MGIENLLDPFDHGKIHLPNRFAMAPMTRQASLGGIPGPEVAEYYRRRAAGGVGLIISEGAFIPHDSAGWSALIPNLEGSEAERGWRGVLDAVHGEGAQMYCQLWHQGVARDGLTVTRNPQVPSVGPSGIGLDGNPAGEVLTPEVIDAVITAYADAATFCQKIGFDGIELHGAHGYLLDQFLWARTNLRSDEFADPLLFPTRVVSAIRAAVGPDFPIVFRFSQWKVDHYDVRLAETPDELGVILSALHTAGVDMFHASTRRFWEPAFPEADSQLTLAGWARKLTGAPTIIVGSVGLDTVFTDSEHRSDPGSAKVTGLDRLVELFDQGHFDVVAVGRALLSEPEWVHKHATNRMEEIQPYARHFREVLS